MGWTLVERALLIENGCEKTIYEIDCSLASMSPVGKRKVGVME